MKYLVEFMAVDAVTSSLEVEASTPFLAASKASRGSMVDFSIDRADWIRVTPPGKPPFEFGHSRVVETQRKPVRKVPEPGPGKTSVTKTRKPDQAEAEKAVPEPDDVSPIVDEASGDDGSEALKSALQRLWTFDHR